MSNEEVFLAVNERRYAGWKSIRITRSIESLSGSFTLEANDRWSGDDAPWPILEEDACRVEIGDKVVIDGYVDKRSLSASASSRTLTYSGRDRAAALVDCSAVLGGWSFRNVDVAEFASRVAQPFGIRVTVQAGLKLARVPLAVLSPGDSAFDAIRTVAADSGVLFVSDGRGGIVITRAGTERAEDLVEGDNILSANVDYDASERFCHYVISTQTAGTDENFGDATRVLGAATDEGVRRFERVLLIRPDKGYDAAGARKRADWEARIRAARSARVSVSVAGWTQRSGALWPLNARSRVKAPRLIDVDGDMLISQIEHSVDERGGRITQLSLIRPDAFTPEPQAVVRARPAGWPELRTGGFDNNARAFVDPARLRANLAVLMSRLGGQLRGQR